MENLTGRILPVRPLPCEVPCKLYFGIGETKARELMTKTNNPYTVRIGGRLYANKVLLDKWLLSVSGNRI